MNTMAMTEVVELIRAEASQLQDFFAGLRPEECSRPSACAGWTVGDVFAHVTQGARTWSEAITRSRAGDFDPPPGQPPLRPGERGSAVTAQRAIDFRQGMGEAPFCRPLSVITSAYIKSCWTCNPQTGINPASIVVVSCQSATM
jgi:Mycothiol maleylpyruvate isomerase N-terminal domain